MGICGVWCKTSWGCNCGPTQSYLLQHSEKYFIECKNCRKGGDTSQFRFAKVTSCNSSMGTVELLGLGY